MTWKKNMVYLCDYSDDNFFEILDGTQIIFANSIPINYIGTW